MRTSNHTRPKKAKKKHGGSIDAAAQQLDSSSMAGSHQFGRSRVSNHAARGSLVWLDHVDKRGPIARRFKDVVALVTSDLGGPTELSEAQRQIIRRIASLSVWCESQEAKMADGDEININEFQRTSNSLRRLCESIGLERRAKDITPSLDQYLANKRSRQAEDADDYEEAEEAVT